MAPFPRWCKALLLTAVVSAFVAFPAGAQAAPFVLTPNADTSPGIAIDAAGTAHIAWGTMSGAAYPYTYSLTYCQVPRGATACAKTKVMANGGNQNNYGSTQVFLVGSKIIILASMTDGVIMRESTDGGTSFSAGYKMLTQPGAFALYRSAMNQAGTGAVVNDSSGTHIGFVAFDGSSFAQQPPDLSNGTSDDEREVLGHADVGWLNATTPFATQMGYLTNHLFTRFFNSATTGYNTGANWLHETKIDTSLSQSAIATGPAGAFIASSTSVGHPFGSDEIALYRVNDAGVAAAPIPLVQETTPPHSPTNIDLEQDAGGRLHAAWTDTGLDGHLYYEWSKDSVNWSAPTLIQLPENQGGFDNRIAVAPDGGGWILTDSNGGGAVLLTPLDPKGDANPPARPPPPGPTPPPTTPPASLCPQKIQVTADAPAVVRSGGCFANDPKGSKLYTTTGSIRIGGIDLVPKGSGKLTVDTANHTIVSKGASYEIRAGAVILGTSKITWNLTNPVPSPGVSAFGVKLFGLGVVGVADVWFTKGEGRIQINLDLPSPLDAIHANTVLRTTMADGLIVDGFAVDAKNVPIGPVNLSSFHLAYSSGADTLDGSFAMQLPPGASDNVTGGLGLAGGSFKHAELEIGPGVPPLPLPLFATPPITLNTIGAAAKNDSSGFSMTGKIGLVAGGQIAGSALVNVDGSLTLFVPSSRAYASIRAEGKVRVVGVPLGGGFVEIRSDGPLTFGGAMSIDFEVVEASFKTAGGINLANGDFYASGAAHVGVNLVVIAGTVDASSIISSVGVAACGAITGSVPGTGIKKTIELGFQKPWGKDSELGGCNIDKYVPASLANGASARAFGPKAFEPFAHAAQIGGRQFKLKGGKMAGVKVSGNGGRPGFTLSGPNGRTITVPANMPDPVIGGSVAAIPAGPDSVELQVSNPAGTWSVTPDGAAPAIRQIYAAGVLPKPTTVARVKRSTGQRRVLSVSTSNLGSQSLLLRELLPGGAAHELGRVTANGRKKVGFTPAIAAGGKRDIEAVILNGSKVVGTKKIASYTAPRSFRLPAPKRVTLVRKRAGRTNVAVRWPKVAGAASYRVLITANDGRREYFLTKRSVTRLAVPNVTYGDKVTVKVQAMPKFGPAGTSRAATSKAIKLKKKKKASTKKK